MQFKSKTLALIVLSSAAVAAHATVLTFDALPVGTTLSNQYAGVTFSANAMTGAGWAANTDMTIVSATGPDTGFDGLGTPGLAFGNVLRSFTKWQSEGGNPSFRVSFATAISSFSADFAAVYDPSNVQIFAYDGNTLLGSVTGTSPNSQFELGITGSHITSVIVTPGTLEDYVAVDNITYTAAAVPEPATWALLTLGLGTLAWARRGATRR